MQTYEHYKSQLFTLIGRPVTLNTPYAGSDGKQYTQGSIVEQLGPARFGLMLFDSAGVVYCANLKPITVDFSRAEFSLPPLPSIARHCGAWLSDNSDGFAYADDPDFVNKFARVN